MNFAFRRFKTWYEWSLRFTPFRLVKEGFYYWVSTLSGRIAICNLTYEFLRWTTVTEFCTMLIGSSFRAIILSITFRAFQIYVQDVSYFKADNNMDMWFFFFFAFYAWMISDTTNHSERRIMNLDNFHIVPAGNQVSCQLRQFVVTWADWLFNWSSIVDPRK